MKIMGERLYTFNIFMYCQIVLEKLYQFILSMHENVNYCTSLPLENVITLIEICSRDSYKRHLIVVRFVFHVF